MSQNDPYNLREWIPRSGDPAPAPAVPPEYERAVEALRALAAARRKTDIATCPCEPEYEQCDHVSFDKPLMEAEAALAAVDAARGVKRGAGERAIDTLRKHIETCPYCRKQRAALAAVDAARGQR